MNLENYINTFELKQINWVSYLAIFSAIVWSILFFVLIVFNMEVSFCSQNMEFISLILNMMLTYKIWKNTRLIKSNIVIYFFLSNVFFFLVNVWYFIVYSRPHISSFIWLFDCIIILWFIFTIIFFAKILLQYVVVEAISVPLKRIIITLSAFILADIIIFIFFSIDLHYTFGAFNLSDIIQLVKLIADLIIFDLAILLLVYSKNKGITLIASGYIIIIASEFMFTSIYMSKMTVLLNYCELLWFLGILVLLFGNIKIIKDKSYDIKDWFKSVSTIKSTLTFWSFSVSFISFIIFFVIVKQFATVDKIVFVFFPTIIMLYSMLIGYVSILIANIFEQPFKQISENIELLMLDDDVTNLNNNFSTEEFIFLQRFILKAFKYRDEKNKVVVEEQNKFKDTVGKMLHDMGAPLSSLGTIATEANSNIPEDTRITLRNATNRISDLTRNLLNRYKSKKVEEEQSITMLVSLALLQIISEKRFQYYNSNVKIKHTFEKTGEFAFIDIVPSDFQRMISNLITNGVEAAKDRPNILISILLRATLTHLVIFIQDNGYGMPQHIREKFFEGTSISENKKDGHGVGLTQVHETIYSNAGTCDIYVEDNVSTEMVIKFPIASTPHWIASEIKISKDDTVVILDDDDSIHGAWDAKFKNILEKFPTTCVAHYTKGEEAINYINSLTNEQKQDIFLLTDYELLEQGMNGLDVVKNTGILRAVLVTSHASNPEIQELVIKSGIKALPKELTYAVAITVDKKIPKWSKCVDMVWVEDQKWFIDETIHDFFSHLKIDTYYDPNSFMDNVQQYPLNTRIILDTYYYAPDNKIAYNLDGFTIARMLHEIGYTKLILFSGEVIDREVIPDYLTVILKTDNEAKKILDKI